MEFETYLNIIKKFFLVCYGTVPYSFILSGHDLFIVNSILVEVELF